ncbi:MAG TPA: hypothetical protein VGG83_27380 [Trebonia sp.]
MRRAAAAFDGQHAPQRPPRADHVKVDDGAVAGDDVARDGECGEQGSSRDPRRCGHCGDHV